MAANQQGVPIAPLTGLLDTRTPPDLLAQGSLRYRQNFRTYQNQATLRRGSGWEKMLSQAQYVNSDFHDQMLAVTSTPNREPVTFTYEAEDSLGDRTFFIGTQSRLAKLDPGTGTYLIIGSGFGGGPGTTASGPRFNATSLGDYAFFTNGNDIPQYGVLTAGTPSVSPWPDLSVVQITQARRVFAWRNVLFLANIIMAGNRRTNRIIWSDYNSPLSLDPSIIGSITGFFDLDYGEVILNGMELGNSFLIYTDRSIWEMTVNSSTTGSAFLFRRLPGVAIPACLKYENTLIDVGDGHVYAGTDRIYFFNQYAGIADPLEWLHSGDSLAFENLDTSSSTAHIAGFDGIEAYFSFVTLDSPNGCPDITIRANREYKTVDIIDHGFTAMGLFLPQTGPAALTLQQWINQVCAATTCIYTTVTRMFGGYTVEDVTQPTPDPHSLCVYLEGQNILNCGTTIATIGDDMMAAVSSVDWCVKELGSVFYRERCTNPTANGVLVGGVYTPTTGTYLLDGYDSIIKFAPAWSQDSILIFSQFMLNYTAAPQASPSSISFTVGISGQPVDPNNPAAPIKYFPLSSKLLKYQAGPITPQTAPARNLQWNFSYEGAYVHATLKISGTGGDCVLSSAIGDFSSHPRRNY